MTYRNIQGMRAIAALMVVSCHMFWSLVPMRTQWAKPFFAAVGPAGVDIFFVISGFIIYHVVRRSVASLEQVGRGRAVFAFAMKRFIRIYPLYWIAFAAACLVMLWSPPTALPLKKPVVELLMLVDSIPNYVVGVAWTLTYEVYFYGVAALSLLILGKRALWGLAFWFSVLIGAAIASAWRPWTAPLDYLFAPILLEFLLGMAVGMLVERGARKFHGTMFLAATVWTAAGTWLVARDPASYLLRVACWGMPAAVIIYGVITLELRSRWIMPRAVQYLGDASFSLYLWHVIVFDAMVGAFARLGWIGVINPVALTAVMVAAAMGTGLLSYHYLEKPLLRCLGQWFVGQRVASNALGTEAHAGNLAA